ncbi:metal-dependent transcriptional regulator [Candidatus Chloroploca sp. Khr17]|uniref:metal-dependent transcriptional regulator n=1 Tax=Candidatus Chloroploca sp. Khr17 TaxID=2496869 RepID=UPI001F0F50DC|nr:metal-dependent transcriptional regulator [Candidatus Chloroploca sp. Khr17]
MGDPAMAKRAHQRTRTLASSGGPTDKERDYLELIYALTQSDEPVIAASLGRRLGVQPPTVSHALQQLVDKGFILRDERNQITLTSQGQKLAEEIVQRQRVLEHFLASVVGIPWHLLYVEAARLERVLSPILAERVFSLVGPVTSCPHGNPIPGRSQTYVGDVRLDTATVGTMFTIQRIAEEAEAQVDLMRYLELNSLTPGTQCFIPDTSPVYGVTLRRCNQNITVSPEVAAVVWGDSALIT